MIPPDIWHYHHTFHRLLIGGLFLFQMTMNSGWYTLFTNVTFSLFLLQAVFICVWVLLSCLGIWHCVDGWTCSVHIAWCMFLYTGILLIIFLSISTSRKESFWVVSLPILNIAAGFRSFTWSRNVFRLDSKWNHIITFHYLIYLFVLLERHNFL